MTVNLIIKSATQTVEDFSLHCDLTWTIGRIKDHIAEVYPSKPKRENQKLIYGGKLLPDHLSLKSILNHSQERHIMHLVCPSPAKSANQTESKEATSTQTFPVPPTNPAFPQMSQPIISQGISSMPAVNVTPFTGDAFQQYLAMQQMYAQFMTQYLSQYNGGVPPVVPYGPAMSVPPVPTLQMPVPQQNIPPNPPRPQILDEEVHDYLDYMYIFSRGVMLFAVLYYYSSLHRVLIVVSMFLFISLYMKLNRRNQQDLQRQANERQRNESVATQPAPADIQAAGNEETDPTTAEENASLSQQTEGRSFASMISVTVSLITAFFSSLIPSEPVPVNVN